MKYNLRLRPFARSRDGVEYGSGPIMQYEVEGLPDDRKISIRNVRAGMQEPIWQVGAHVRGRQTRWTGTFETDEEALAQLQEQIDLSDEEVGEVAQ
jgi:hypothetical protein